jgi:site-specific DNA-methyltransferase (adenine-specific)
LESIKKRKDSPDTKTRCTLQMAFKNYANEGDKILDTHLGSGSIAIACHDMGFDLTACELDTDYYNAAIKRLTDHQKQLKLL